MHLQMRRPQTRYLGYSLYQHGPTEAEFCFDEVEKEEARRDPIGFYEKAKALLLKMGIKEQTYEMSMFEDAMRRVIYEEGSYNIKRGGHSPSSIIDFREAIDWDHNPCRDMLDYDQLMMSKAMLEQTLNLEPIDPVFIDSMFWDFTVINEEHSIVKYSK